MKGVLLVAVALAFVASASAVPGARWSPPAIEVASHGVSARVTPHFCPGDLPKEENGVVTACTAGPLPVPRLLFPVHSGSWVVLRLRTKARFVRVSIGDRPYAYGWPANRARTAWNFRIPDRPPRAEELLIRIEYPRGRGAIGLNVVPHRH